MNSAGWWIALVRGLLAKETKEAGGAGLVELGRRLADRVGRRQAFDHGLLSKLKDGKDVSVTGELAEALSKEFDLEPPVFYPRSRREAVAMQGVWEAFDQPETPVATPAEIADRVRTIQTHGIRKRHR